MSVGISLPPMPSQAAVAGVASVCLIVGALLNLRGRTLARIVLPLIGAALGAAAAPWIVRHIPFKNVWVVGTVAALTMGVVVFIISRPFWAILLGAGLGIAGLVILVRTGAPLEGAPSWPAEAPADFAAWCAAAGGWLAGWVKALFRERLAAAVLVTGLPLVAVTVLELFIRRSVQMVSTAIVGAMLVVGGALGLAWGAKVEWVEAVLDRPIIPLIAVGVLAALGMALQIIGESRARVRAAEEEEEEQEESGAENENAWT